MDGAYTYIDSPIGTLFVAASTRGVVRVGFEDEPDPIVLASADVGGTLTPLEEADEATSEVLNEAVAELGEYFAGDRTTFSVPIDLHMAGFRGQVVRALADITYGQRATYKEIADDLGNPGATRAVGSACANNPIPIILPCHRVVRSDGTWGQYRGGPEAKTYLLAMEQG